MRKDDDFIDGFGLGFHDEFDNVNSELGKFLHEMSEIITPEIEFTEVIQQLPDKLDCNK